MAITYIHNEAKQVKNETYIWFIGNCLSTDPKPVDKIYDASKLFELDTLKTYAYDRVNGWQEVSGGGSGEGSSISSVVYMNTETLTLNKTFDEIRIIAESTGSVSLIASAGNQEFGQFRVMYLCRCAYSDDDGLYSFQFIDPCDNNTLITFTCNSRNDYPVFYNPGDDTPK